MANKVGPLIKSARTDAGLTQEELAKKVDGVSASDISKAERGEKELSQAALKQIAKATGVTQTSLLEAAKNSTYSGTKSTTSKTSSSKSSSSKTSSSKSTKSSSSKDELQLTAAEKKLVELYRAADSDTKKAAVKLLKGEDSPSSDLLTTLIGAVDLLTKK